MAEQKTSGDEKIAEIHNIISNAGWQTNDMVRPILQKNPYILEHINHTSWRETRTLLIHAIEQNRIRYVKDLLDFGADPLVPIYNGYKNALNAAILEHRKEILLLLLEKVSGEHIETMGSMYVIQAIKANSFDCLEIFINKGALRRNTREENKELAKLANNYFYSNCGALFLPEFGNRPYNNASLLTQLKYDLEEIASTPWIQYRIFIDGKSEQKHARKKKLKAFF